ncbi:MAG TPA: hypothetical protein VJ876_00810, partial [Bacteroidales bacterium]|nr:hypothetical protein [Bacteroidales bacterium]
HGTLMALSILVLIITLLYWPLAYFIRKEYHQPLEKHLSGGVKFVGWLAAVVFLIFVLALNALMNDPNQIVFGLSPAIRFIFVLPIIGAVLTLVVLYMNYRVWQRRVYNLSGKIHYTLLSLSLLASLWQLNHWNMLGFHF